MRATKESNVSAVLSFMESNLESGKSKLWDHFTDLLGQCSASCIQLSMHKSEFPVLKFRSLRIKKMQILANVLEKYARQNRSIPCYNKGTLSFWFCRLCRIQIA